MSLNPASWSKRTKVIVSIAILLLTIALVLAGFAWHNHSIKTNCRNQQETFAKQNAQLDDLATKAKETLALVSPSGDASPAAHTDGFLDSDGANDRIGNLKSALAKASELTDLSAPSCVNGKDLRNIRSLTESRTKAFDSLSSANQELSDAIAKFRLDKAASQAKADMDSAKAELDKAIANTDSVLTSVTDSGLLSSNSEAKDLADQLRATKDAEASDKVEVDSYDNALATIERAKAIRDKAAKLTELSNKLSALSNPSATSQSTNTVQASGNWQASAGANTAPSNSAGGSGLGGSSEGGCYCYPGSELTVCGSGPPAPGSLPIGSPACGVHDTYTGPPVWFGYSCPNHPGADRVTYRSTNGWTQDSASADCGAPVS